MKIQKTICLMGFMGSGKSTIGEIIANRLSCSWVDTDQIIEQNQGQKISCLVERFGWPYFREIESNTFKDLIDCLLYTSPSPRDLSTSRMPSSA